MAELLIPAELTHASRSWYTRKEARINARIVEREARKLAKWLKSDACPDTLDAQPIMLRLGRAWYIAAEYQYQSASDKKLVYVDDVTIGARTAHPELSPTHGPVFESRIYVLGKPHVKDSQGRTPFISCRYVWYDEDDGSEWYIGPSMDVEFTRTQIESGHSHINPYFEKYHPFGSWFHMHKAPRVFTHSNHPRTTWDRFANCKRISMQCVDLDAGPTNMRRPARKRR